MAVPNNAEEQALDESFKRLVEEADADARLRELNEDLSVELFREVVVSACRDYVSKINGYAPNTAKGTTVYDFNNMILRGRLCGDHGWSKDDKKNLPCAISPAGDIRIVCISGGPETGIATLTPSIRKRGPRTFEAYSQAQIPGLETIRGNQDRTFWYLITYVDEVSQKIRAELSCPIIEEDGSVTEWSERILLGQFDLQGVTDDLPSAQEAPVIDVRRRKAADE